MVSYVLRLGPRNEVSSSEDTNGTKLTTVTSDFDYETYVDDIKRDWRVRFRAAIEVRKDLFHLKKAASLDQRLFLLRKLSFAPDLDFYNVALKYSGSVIQARGLFESQLQRTSADELKKHKVIWAAADKLEKKGFDRERAEYEAQSAIAGGIELDPKKIVKAVMRSFRPRN